MPTTWGLDLGAGQLKLIGDTASVVLPSYVTYQEGRAYRPSEAVGEAERPMRIRFSGQQLDVGVLTRGRPVENLDEARFSQGTPGLKAMIYAALTKAGINDGAALRLLVGLPQSAWETSREAPEIGLRAWMLGSHHWLADEQEHTCYVTDLHVVQQPIGALFEYVLDENGSPAQDHWRRCLNKEVAVLSVGFSTLELNVVRFSRPPTLVERFTASETVGVRRLLRLMDPEGRYTLMEMDQQLRLNGWHVPQGPLRIWGDEVVGRIEARWDEAWQRFAAVTVVGGGSILLRERLDQFFEGRAHFPSTPITAVAQGLWRMGQVGG